MPGLDRARATQFGLTNRKPFEPVGRRASSRQGSGDRPNFEPSAAVQPYIETFLQPVEPHIPLMDKIMRRSA